MSEQQSIRQLIELASHNFTPSERRLVNFLYGANPGIALGSVHQLAAQAKISAPTVVRFGIKLGFSGYTEFQRAWVNELESKLSSPLTLLDKSPNSAEQTFGTRLANMVQQAVDQEFVIETIVTLLAETSRRVYLRGGRFSHTLAEYLYAHLHEMRGNVEILGRDWTHDIDSTIDMGKKDIVILFDFRRYQPSSIAFAQRVSAQGASLVVVTDRWQSPAVKHARHTIISDIASGSPYDTLVPAMAQVELLALKLLERLGERATERLRRIESARTDSESNSSIGPLKGPLPHKPKQEDI